MRGRLARSASCAPPRQRVAGALFRLEGATGKNALSHPCRTELPVAKTIETMWERAASARVSNSVPSRSSIERVSLADQRRASWRVGMIEIGSDRNCDESATPRLNQRVYDVG